MILKDDILQLKISLKEAVGDELTDDELEQPIDDTFGTLRYETHNEDESITVDGTSLVGRLYGVSYPKLVTYFGEPIRPDMKSSYDDEEEKQEPDPSDAQASWVIRFADNLVAEIYDRWQDMSPESITEWRVAGKGSTVLHRIHLILEGKGKRGFGSNVLENTKQKEDPFSQKNWVSRVKAGFKVADGNNRNRVKQGDKKYFSGYWLQNDIENTYQTLAEYTPLEEPFMFEPDEDEQFHRDFIIPDHPQQPSQKNPIHEKLAGRGVPLQAFVDEFCANIGRDEFKKFMDYMLRWYPAGQEFYTCLCKIMVALWSDFKNYSEYLAENNGGYDHALIAIQNAWQIDVSELKIMFHNYDGH